MAAIDDFEVFLLPERLTKMQRVMAEHLLNDRKFCAFMSYGIASGKTFLLNKLERYLQAKAAVEGEI